MEKLKYGSRRWKELTSQHAWHSDKIEGKPVMVCYNNEYYYELPRDKNPTRFLVEYNGKYVADYKSVRACLKFINRKGLQDDYENTLRIVDNNGDMYNTISGTKITKITWGRLRF